MKNKISGNKFFMFAVLAVSVARLLFSPVTEEASAAENKKVILGGQAIGVKLYTKGVHVLKLSDAETAEGLKTPAKDAGIKKGDYITHVDDTEIVSYEQFSNLIQNKDAVNLTLMRNNENHVKTMNPAKCTDGVYRAGIWVRDSAAGIGTVTFYDKEDELFVALGHGITDADTKKLLQSGSGQAQIIDVTSVVKGTEGVPGELNGEFKGKDGYIGDLIENTKTGTYFKLMTDVNGIEVPIASKDFVREGEAEIWSTLDGSETKAYKVRITKVIRSNIFTPKGMLIEVTDPLLLEKTGGVVCGMSGSPIVQDGKLVGAVTHVFVNDPTRGYGIFIENMLAEEKNKKESLYSFLF